MNTNQMCALKELKCYYKQVDLIFNSYLLSCLRKDKDKNSQDQDRKIKK